MTIAKVLDRVVRLKPNSLTNVDIVDFINEVEADIIINILKQPFTPVTDFNAQLIAPTPYDHIYFDYLLAKIDYLNGDAEFYSLSSRQYNSTMNDLTAYCIQNRFAPSFSAKRTDWY